jgi:hypothetical protein
MAPDRGHGLSAILASGGPLNAHTMMILDAAWMSSDLARGSVQDLDFPFVARSHAAASSPLPTFQAVLIQIHKLITIQHV